MKILRVSLLVAAACLAVRAEEPPPRKTAAEVDATCKRADEAYADSIKRAEAQLEKARKEAQAVKLKTYKERLAKTTQAGDFDRASVIKADIEALENPKPTIPKDAVKFGGHHYMLIREPATWHVAKKRCEQMGGHLACAKTPQEAEFLINYLQQSKSSAWFGATDEESEGKWVWLDGHAANLPATAIDNHEGVEHYLQWNLGDQKWNDECDGVRIPYLCEWDK